MDDDASRPAETAEGGSVTTFAEAAMMNRFRHDYLNLLDGRLATIRRCLAAPELENARTAMLSLESTSCMVGAEALAARLHELRGMLTTCSAVQRESLVAAIENEAQAVRERLSV